MQITGATDTSGLSHQMYNTHEQHVDDRRCAKRDENERKTKITQRKHNLMTDILSADVILMLHFWNSTKTEKLNLHLLHIATTAAAASLHLPFFSSLCVVEHWSWFWLVVFCTCIMMINILGTHKISKDFPFGRNSFNNWLVCVPNFVWSVHEKRLFAHWNWWFGEGQRGCRSAYCMCSVRTKSVNCITSSLYAPWCLSLMFYCDYMAWGIFFVDRILLIATYCSALWTVQLNVLRWLNGIGTWHHLYVIKIAYLLFPNECIHACCLLRELRRFSHLSEHRANESMFFLRYRYLSQREKNETREQRWQNKKEKYFKELLKFRCKILCRDAIEWIRF